MLVVVVLGGFVGGSYVLSSLLLDPHHNLTRENVEVVATTDTSITLTRTKTSATPGAFGIDWVGGHAIIGQITSSDADTVTRAVTDIVGALTAGIDVAIDPGVWQGDPLSARNVAFDNVVVPSPLGDMPGLVHLGQRHHLGVVRARY